MSLIQYQQATYAVRLRDELELAGCDPRVAALISRTVGEVIEHASHVCADARRDLEARRRDLFERFIGVALFMAAVAVASGVLVMLCR